MPELPEVETVLRVLQRQLENKRIIDVDIKYGRIVHYPNVDEFVAKLKNQHFRSFNRLGKHLIITLDDYILVSHLRMEGKYYFQTTLNIDKHSHIVFKLANNEFLVYHDTRKFGTMHLYTKDEPLIALNNTGIDALSISEQQFYERSINKKYTLKQLLLDQKIMAGVGNIYADEIIFAAGLHPLLKVNTLQKKDFDAILQATKKILNEAILAGGTTIRSYTSSYEIDGRFQQQLNVHTMKKCGRCNNDIEKIKVAGRGTYVCPNCQKIK